MSDRRPPRRPIHDPYWGPVWGIRHLSDGREVVLVPLGWGQVQLGVSVERGGFWADSWYYENVQAAWPAFTGWDGTGEPEGWVRHPFTGRRRVGGDPATEVVRP